MPLPRLPSTSPVVLTLKLGLSQVLLVCYILAVLFECVYFSWICESRVVLSVIVELCFQVLKSWKGFGLLPFRQSSKVEGDLK